MFIEVDTRVRLEDLIRGMIIQSGNDASVALAEHVAGTEETFAALMNEHAQILGMTATSYQNSTGLPFPDHYTTARDAAILARAIIIEFPDYYGLYSEREFTYNDIRQHNRNSLLWRDTSVDGMKTGYTEDAGYCLVTSAERSGMRLISVVMGMATAEARIPWVSQLPSSPVGGGSGVMQRRQGDSPGSMAIAVPAAPRTPP